MLKIEEINSKNAPSYNESFWILLVSKAFDLTERNANHIIPSYCYLPVAEV